VARRTAARHPPTLARHPRSAGTLGRPAQTSLRVPYPRDQVRASPAVDENTLDNAAGRSEIKQFYTAQTG
jgi:hypothetical protein